jgi:hypothetical protein
VKSRKSPTTKKGEEKKEAEKANEAARVWIPALKL